MSKLNLDFSTFYQIMITRHLEKKPDLYEMINTFRHYRAQMTVKKGASHSIFAIAGITL